MRAVDLSSSLHASGDPIVSDFDGLLIDLDGVVYRGRQAVPRSVPVLNSLAGAGVHRPFLGFVTNNAARSAADVAGHLRELGVVCASEQVVTSAQLAAESLARLLPGRARVLVVGGLGLVEAVEQVGLSPVSRAAEQPQAVVQGFGPDVGWQQLAEASAALATGVPWVVTNLDLTVPTAHGLAPGNGALVEAVVHATGRRPDTVVGKPEAAAFVQSARRWGIERPLVVGDRLDTDIAGARAAGLASLLVLTGVTTVLDLLSAEPAVRPAFIGRDLAALLEPHPQVAIVAGTSREVTVAGDTARAIWSSDHWELTEHRGAEAASTEIDLVRVVAVASWWALDHDLPMDRAAIADQLKSVGGWAD